MKIGKPISLVVLIPTMLLLSSTTQTTELRLMGMGDLRLVVEDESNMLNLYDFGGNVAGLYLDEPMSTLKGGFSYGGVSFSDTGGTLEEMPKVTYLGQPVPENVMGYIPAPYRDMLPAGGPLGVDVSYRMEASAIRVRGDYANAKLTFEEMDPEQSVTVNTFPSTMAQYSTLFADQLSLGLQVGYLRAKQTADPELLESTVSNFGAGLGIGFYLSEVVGLGATFNYMKPKFETGIDSISIDGLDLLDFSADLDGSGFDFGLQGVLQAPGLLKAGARLGFNSLSGDASVEAVDTAFDVGSVKTSGFAMQTRLLTTFPLVPLQLAASLGYMSETAKLELTEDLGSIGAAKQDTLAPFEGSVSTFPIGIGFVYSTPMLTLGGEFHYSSVTAKEEESDESESISTTGFNLGAEVPLVVAALRGGLVYSKSNPEEDSGTDPMTMTKYTVGVGVTPPGSMVKADFAYNYISHKIDDDAETKMTTSLFSVGLKFYF